ncbi:MAG: FAD-binding oxidoreductase [Proteobacteria bacterium]|nr:FAD-binding oxidoreductase [Pseudomonadota bacterium]
MNIESWGRYPKTTGEGYSFETVKTLAAHLEKNNMFIPYGMGRSYGDSALNEKVILTRRYDKLIQFDPEQGIVICESGVTLDELIRIFLKKGWFLSVTPGTKFVTVGGAIASDVHGKNHHKAGCFSNSVLWFDLMLPDGRIVRCDREKNRDLFLATAGGMGLTGIILTAAIKLKPVKSAYIRETVVRCNNLKDAFEKFEIHEDATYSVAWIDCLSKGKAKGRSVLMAGENASTGAIDLPRKRTVSIPLDLPSFCLNSFSVKCFNHLYYMKSPQYTENRLTPLDTFFYPLDAIGHWNRIYGKKGFTQYQMVLPKASSFEGLDLILDKISSAGMGSFLAVLKLFGPQNDNYLSFPMEGYTLALDFKIQSRLFAFLDHLDDIVTDYGGRIYLTKDVRMSPDTFKKGYPAWDTFSALRQHYGMNQKFQSLQSKRIGV